MDVMSLEHNFGNEFQTSLKQLFQFFCNNVNLGQWQAAKSCIQQLKSNCDNLKIDFDQLLNDIIQNPSAYCNGSNTLKSSYHLSLLMYEYCVDNNLIIKSNDKFDKENQIDEILFKFLLLIHLNNDSNKIICENNEQLTNEKDSINALIDYYSTLDNKINDKLDKLKDYLVGLLQKNTEKTIELFKLLIKHKKCTNKLFNIHLNTIEICLNSINEDVNDTNVNFLLKLLSYLFIYKVKLNDKNELSALSNCFKSICTSVHAHFGEIEARENFYFKLYSSLLVKDEENDNDGADTIDAIKYLDLFLITQYDYGEELYSRKQDPYPLLSIIKQYSSTNKRVYFWKHLYLYCIMERKILIKSLIDECLLMIENNCFDNLSMIFTIKEFFNLKPLILLLGISKVKDIQSSKKLIATLCLNNAKGSLIDKLGNLFKTHLDFMNWFQLIPPENRKKEIQIIDLVKMLHRQLPLNIISQCIDINKLDNSEITKILRNTLVDKDTGEKTKWVRFMDEVNEKISLIQEACLSIYNGYFCINKIFNAIMYSCEHLNKRIYSTNITDSTRHLLKQQQQKQQQQHSQKDNKKSEDQQLQHDYTEHILNEFESVRKILSQINSLYFRLELFENIYSLIFIMSNHLKDDDDDEEDEKLQDDHESNTHEDIDSSFNHENQTPYDYKANSVSNVDILMVKTNNPLFMENETSIYSNSNVAFETSKSTNCSSKSTLGSCSHGSSSSMRRGIDNSRGGQYAWLRNNAGGGGNFLVNDFICRDLLLLLKELLNEFSKQQKSSSFNEQNSKQQQLNSFICCSIVDKSELNTRFARLQQLVNETLWRFQLIKTESISNDYGKINVQICVTESKPSIDSNDYEELLAFSILKRFTKDSTKYERKYTNSTEIKSRSNTLSIITTSVNENGNNKRSIHSQKSLSLILPKYKQKRSNLIIMKLLCDTETLCVLCLKEMKLSEANQLVKLYSKNNNSTSFAFQQVNFYTSYENLLTDLELLNKIYLTTSKNNMEKEQQLVEKSLMSVESSKIIEKLIEKEDNTIIRTLFLCDIITILNANALFTSDIVNYALINLSKTSKEALFTNKNNDNEDNVQINKEDQLEYKRFENEIKEKLFSFIQTIQQITSNSSALSFESTITNFITKFNGISFVKSSKNNNEIDQTKSQIERFIEYKQMNSKLNELKYNFENEEEKRKHKESIISSMMSKVLRSKSIDEKTNENQTNNASSSNRKHDDTFLQIINLLKGHLNINNNEDLISNYFVNRTEIQDDFQRENEKPVENNSNPDQNANYLLSFYEYCKTLYEYFLDKDSLSAMVTNSYFSILNSSPAALICKLIFQDSIKPQLIEPLTNKLNLNLTAIILHNSCPRLKLTLFSEVSQLLFKMNSHRSESNASAHMIQNSNQNELIGTHEDATQGTNEIIHRNSFDELNLVSQNCLDYYNSCSFYTILNKSEVAYSSSKVPDELVRELLLKVLKYCKKYLLNNEDASSIMTKNELKGINIEIASCMYDCAEFKALLNETQEFEHLDLSLLQTENQKLSFFINLHNLLSIQSHFYFASIRFKSNDYQNSTFTDKNLQNCLFRNDTEKLLISQRMCYRIGQMGCVTLFDLKYLILNVIQKSFQTNKIPNLLKYSLHILDTSAEPLWSRYIPSTTLDLNNKILFALINCVQSDVPICVFNSDTLLSDQLNIQMSVFLNESIYIDLSDGILYIPSLLIENIGIFLPSSKPITNRSTENLINFLMENLSSTLCENLKRLVDMHPFDAKNNENEFSFKVVQIDASNEFSVVLDYDQNSWYKNQIKLNVSKSKPEQNKVPSFERQSSIETPLLMSHGVNSDGLNVNARQLNKDCIEYIQVNSPLISNSLSFLFDATKRDLFFNEISTHKQETPNTPNKSNSNASTEASNTLSNSLNRFIQLHVPLEYIKHLDIQTKLNLITQFLLTNKTDESKIELIIELANYYAQLHEWSTVLNLLNNCMQDNEEFNDIFETNSLTSTNSLNIGATSTTISSNLAITNDTTQNRTKTNIEKVNSRFTLKDLYNLYDYACICSSSQDASKNEKSFTNLFKIKNFLKQIRYCFSLMYLWSIDGCLELIEFCVTKFKSFDQPLTQNENVDSNNAYKEYIIFLNDKKKEFKVYKELQICAKTTIDTYFSSDISLSVNQPFQDPGKMKTVCQMCLKWQSVKEVLERSNKTEEDDETINLIMDLFLINQKFESAKFLCKKLKLNQKLKFKLDYSHLKHRLLHINANTVINFIDMNAIVLSDYECITFANEIEGIVNQLSHEYIFKICYQLLNEFKELKYVNNAVIISLCEFIFSNYSEMLNDKQIEEMRIFELTAKIFSLFSQEQNINIDLYKKHYSNPLLIIEQLLMNSKIDLCSKTIKLCREVLPNINDNTNSQICIDINKLLVAYANKALEFRVYVSNSNTSTTAAQKSQLQTKPEDIKSKSPSSFRDFLLKRSSQQRMSVDVMISSSSPLATPSSGRFGHKASLVNTPPNSFLAQMSPSSSGFVMPLIPPTKDQWIKDELVNECMVCNTERFTLLNRRHHCRRCGRVVCSNCSQRVTLIRDIPQRTCDDCFKQIEMNNFLDKRQHAGTINEDSEFDSRSPKKSTNVPARPKAASMTELNDQISWQLVGENERDEEIRGKFRFQQAPSTSLCLSILDLHDRPLECGKELLAMCDNLSSYLQTANYQVEDIALIINMIKYLLCNAKIKLLQNSSTNMISTCDTYLSLIDILEQLLLANCANIPSLYDLRNTESARRIRNRLLEEERHELAMNLSTKCGLDTQTVWASWGLTELKRGNYKEARTKFEKCLKSISDKHQSLNQSQMKILSDIILYFETAPPIKITGPQNLLAPLRSIDLLIAEPVLYCTDDSNMDELQLKESIYYLDTYGNHLLMAQFYQKHSYLQKALQYLLDNKCNPEVFVEGLLIPCLKTAEFYQLLDYMLLLDRSQQKFHSYFIAIGKHLEKSYFLNTLYDFQLFMKDYIRACMSCICLFSRNCQNYTDLANNLHYLIKARQHLDQYLELCSIKSIQPQNLAWKQKTEQQSLCKQMPTPEVDNYLKAINLQIEVTRFLSAATVPKNKELSSNPTLFGNNDAKMNVCCLVLLSGQTIQDGFGFVIRIIQCFNLNPTLVYSQAARELAKQFNFKEIRNLLKSIDESGYKEDLNSSYDECISSCLRVFAAVSSSFSTQSNNTPNASNSSTTESGINTQQQQLNKEIEELIQLIKDEQNKINAYILTGRLRSAYLIAIKTEKAETVKHIANVAERMGQHLIKDICNKWLEKYQSK